jgi:hypothetical protein
MRRAIGNVIMKEAIMEEEVAAAGAKIHPVIAALEKIDEATVVIHGYRGTSDDASLRLYPALETSAYVEIPKGAVVHLQAEEDGEPGSVRAFVRASSEISTVQRSRVRAADWNRALPPIQPRPTFWRCAGQCEGVFVDLVIRIHIDEARALMETDPQRQQVLLAQIAQQKHEAKKALLFCLTNCVDTYGAPRFMAVPDASARGGFRLEPFSLPGYHALLVARHLEAPE